MERSVDNPLGPLQLRPLAEGTTPASRTFTSIVKRGTKRGFDIVVSSALLVITAPVFGVIALLIAVESRGGILYRCHRVGFHGRPLTVLKFRKMRSDASGPALTLADDDRFTRIGRFLAATKLDELPQLWNVFRGDMSLVGPRPEDERFVDLQRDLYATILTVRPGITGLTQLAFARESEILDPNDREGYYVRDLLPQKARIDALYAERRTLWLDVKVLCWTAAALFVRRDIAIDRRTGDIGVRRKATTEDDRRRG